MAKVEKNAGRYPFTKVEMKADRYPFMRMWSAEYCGGYWVVKGQAILLVDGGPNRTHTVTKEVSGDTRKGTKQLCAMLTRQAIAEFTEILDAEKAEAAKVTA